MPSAGVGRLADSALMIRSGAIGAPSRSPQRARPARLTSEVLVTIRKGIRRRSISSQRLARPGHEPAPQDDHAVEVEEQGADPAQGGGELAGRVGGRHRPMVAVC